MFYSIEFVSFFWCPLPTPLVSSAFGFWVLLGGPLGYSCMAAPWGGSATWYLAHQASWWYNLCSHGQDTETLQMGVTFVSQQAPGSTMQFRAGQIKLLSAVFPISWLACCDHGWIISKDQQVLFVDYEASHIWGILLGCVSEPVWQSQCQQTFNTETRHPESFPNGHYPSTPFILKLLELEMRFSLIGQVPILFSPLPPHPTPLTYPCPCKLIIHTLVLCSW